MSPASTDPLIATLFATESSNYGKGVVHIALPQDLAGVKISGGNVFSELEKEVQVHLLPGEFAQRASLTLTATEARGILTSMGVDVPARIRDITRLDSVLKSSPRLGAAQIEEFLNRAAELKGVK